MIDGPLSIFIASATEGLQVANAVRDALKRKKGFKAKVWNIGTFKPSITFIETLEAELARSDFAVLVLTPDDESKSRGRIEMTPRDNVLLELGLFMGRLGRDRTYFMYDKNKNLKIPTDLLGVSPVTYERRKGQKLEEAIATACVPVADRMRELRVRLKKTPEMETESRLNTTFCERLAGAWWGRQRADEMRFALFRISFDYGTSTVQIDGDTFDQEGGPFSTWRSVAIGVRAKERTLFFCFEGERPTLPGEAFKGFGHYVFDDASGIYESGTGLFADIHMGHKEPPIWKSVELRKVQAADFDRLSEVIKTGTDAARVSEVQRASAQFTGSGGQGPNLG